MSFQLSQSDGRAAGTPLWAMLATFTVAPFAGIVATVRSATLACQHHTVDACIPVGEALFGIAVAAIVFVWLATSRRRHRSITSGLALAVAATSIWLIVMLLIGPLVCPDPSADDVVCPFALPLGVLVFVVVAVSAWRLQRRVDRDHSAPGSGEVGVI